MPPLEGTPSPSQPLWQITRLLFVVGVAILLVSPVLLAFGDAIAGYLEPIATRLSGDQSLDPENLALLHLLTRDAAFGLFAVGCCMLGWSFGAMWLPQYLSSDRVVSLSESRHQRINRLDVAAIGIALAAHLALSIPALTRGFVYDEIFTVRTFVDAPTWREVFTRYVVFNNHIPYSALARLSRIAFGGTEWAYRLPALLLGSASIPAVWCLGRRLFGRPTARVAVVLLAVAPSMIAWSSSARGYTGMLLFSVLSAYWFLDLLARPRVGTAIKYVIVSALGVWFHLYGAFVIVAQVLYLLWLVWREPTRVHLGSFRVLWVCLLATAGGALLLYAPVLPRFWLELHRRGHGTFQPAFPWAVADELSGGMYLVTALAGLGLLLQFRQRRRSRALIALLLTASVVIPWTLRPFDLYPRFLFFLLPWWIFLVAEVIAASFRPFARAHLTAWMRRATASGLAAVILFVWTYRSMTEVPEEGYRAAASVMRAGAGRDTTFVALGGGGFLVSYYLGREAWLPDTPDEFRALVERMRDVRVAYRETSRKIPGHEAIVSFLKDRRADVVHCGNITVFRLQLPSSLSHP